MIKISVIKDFIAYIVYGKPQQCAIHGGFTVITVGFSIYDCSYMFYGSPQ